MPKTLRIGIVGCGKIARANQAPGFAAVPGVRIAALCDPLESQTHLIRDQHAPVAACFTDYERMLVEAEIDALSICSPNRMHAPMTLAALKRGGKSSYACFVAAVRGRTPSPTPGELGREALALCEAITRSGQQGRFVKVKTFEKD